MLWMLAAFASPCPVEDDGVRLHLVSITPGDTLFSSMGHTALVFTAPGATDGLVFNWGAYDGAKATPQAFLTDRLPYYLNRQPLSSVVSRTTAQGRTAYVQRLRLPPKSAERLLVALEQESRPDSREYRYHWADANCATKARDALNAATGGLIRQALDHPVEGTPRTEALRHLWRWPIPGFAWRFTTSSRLDVPMTAWDRAMLPEHLMRDLAAIQAEDGQPLVDATCTLVEGPHGWAPPRPPASWPFAVPGLLGALGVLGAARAGRSRAVGALTAVFGGVLAALGTLSVGLWLPGGMEGVGPSENWLVAGPQTWLLVGAGIARARGRFGPRWRAICVGLGAAALLTLPLNLVTTQGNGDVLVALLPGLLACIAAVIYVERGNSAAPSAERRN